MLYQSHAEHVTEQNLFFFKDKGWKLQSVTKLKGLNNLSEMFRDWVALLGS